MDGYGIFRLNVNLKYQLLLTFGTLDEAIEQLNHMAKKYGWKFQADQTLFGGYWVAPTGACYRVAGHNLEVA